MHSGREVSDSPRVTPSVISSANLNVTWRYIKKLRKFLRLVLSNLDLIKL